MGPWVVKLGDLACEANGTTNAVHTALHPAAGGVPTPGQGCLYGGSSAVSSTRAQQNFIISVPAGDGEDNTYVWTGDRWQQSPDGLKGHEGQFWTPLQFDDDGHIGKVRWVDEFQLRIAKPLALPAPSPSPPTRTRPKASSSWQHSWKSTSEMTFADFNSATVLTDAELDFASAHYRIVSLEKCTGVQSNVTTEGAIWATAHRFKQRDPTTKIIFYLSTEQQGLSCYEASQEFMSNPEWWLKDDAGNVVHHRGHPVMDCTVEAAVRWWVSIPLRGDDGRGGWHGIPVSSLIDGVLADSSHYARYANVSIARLEAIEDAKFRMIERLQKAMTALNGGIVMANGIDMYGRPNADPRDPLGHNLKVLSYVAAVMNEHTAVFESVNLHNASLNVETVSRDLDAIVAAAALDNGSKVSTLIRVL